MSAKVGNDNTNCDRAIRKEGCGIRNANGERLLELCTTYDLVIGGTLFPHTDICKLTWYSPNGRDRIQIDHLMINDTWRRSLLDVKVRRGADVGRDHHLMVAVLKMKLRKTGGRKAGRPRFNVGKLKDPTLKSAFVLQLKNRFQTLADMEDHTQPDADEVNNRWEHVKKAYLKTSEACLGNREKKRNEWITMATWQAIEKRKTLKRRAMEAKPDRLKEKYNLQYKRAFVEILANQAVVAASKGEQEKVYEITKIVCGKYRGTPDALITDKQGRLLTTEAEQEARWSES